MEEFVYIESGGERLLGVWTEPDTAKRVSATVVALHGWGGYRTGPHRMIVKLCRALADAGIASLRFDFRGRGDSTGTGSDATLDTMIEDAGKAVAYAREHAPESVLTLWGICSGGNVAIGAATLLADVAGLVLLSTLPFIPQKRAGEKLSRTRAQAGNYVRKLFRPATWKKLFSGAVNFRAVSRVLFGHYGKPKGVERDPKDSARDIMAAFAGFSGVAHFIYGGVDREAAGAAAHYRGFADTHGIEATFETIEGSNHDFYALAWEQQIIERTVEWVSASVQ
jgi:dienelactone hydrolase